MTLDTNALNHYIHLFNRLKTDRSGNWTQDTCGQAPHKPILLLSMIDLFSQGFLNNNLIQITPELGELFASYWSVVMPPEHRGNMALPFFHLRSSGFWHLVPVPSQEEIIKKLGQIDTLGRLKNLCLGAKLDDELYQLLLFQDARNALRTVLYQHYFSEQFHDRFKELSQLNLDAFQYGQRLLENARKKTKEILPEEDRYQVVRDQGFRRIIVRSYDHRCAFCGIRVITQEGHSVVEAAHIVPWSLSHNDDLDNGMALCRLCHWTFDKGLAALSNEHEIILSGDLMGQDNVPGHLLTIKRRSMIGPTERDLWPCEDYIQWHRLNIFRQ